MARKPSRTSSTIPATAGSAPAYHTIAERIMASPQDPVSEINQLLQKGHEQGSLSLKEIQAHFPADVLDEAFAEKKHAALEKSGISISSRKKNLSAHPAILKAPRPAKITDNNNMHQSLDNISMYLKEVGNIPLLTAEEETQITRRIERGRAARIKLLSGKLSGKKRKQLQYVVEDGWAAREHLILANSRLVVSVAKKYTNRSVPFIDLIQEGSIGLMRAVKKFDYKRGFKFSTYATWWIRQAITRAIADNGRIIRIPVHMNDQITRLIRVTQELTQVAGREPNLHELATAMELSPKQIELIKKTARRPLSLDSPAKEDEDTVIADFTPDLQNPSPDAEVDERMLQKHVRSIIHTLPHREGQILQLRYGLYESKPLTLAEIGRKLGITRERVRQIENQALRRLRLPKIRHQLVDYLEG